MRRGTRSLSAHVIRSEEFWPIAGGGMMQMQPATISPLSRGRIGCRPNRERWGALWRFARNMPNPNASLHYRYIWLGLVWLMPNGPMTIDVYTLNSFFFLFLFTSNTQKTVSQYQHSIEFDNDNLIHTGRWKWADFASNKRPHIPFEKAQLEIVQSFSNLFETLFIFPIRSATAGQDRIHLCKCSTYISISLYMTL